METFIRKSPTIVKVGKNRFKIFKKINNLTPVIQVVSNILIIDDESGEQKVFQTPTPGWSFEKINK